MLLTAFGPFLIAAILTVLSIPVIIRVADKKHLMDEPNSDRKVHTQRTPTLGGVAIFIGLIISFSSFADLLSVQNDIKFMIPALLILFFTGIKDDLVDMPAAKKLGLQLLAASLVSIFGSLKLTSLWGMLGITDIPAYVGSAITFFVIVAMVNAYNLIDGLNGLAAGLALIAAMIFGTWFYLSYNAGLAILSFAMAGALLGFLKFNFSRARIFMGDTGSMLLGFIMAILSIKFIEANRVANVQFSEYYLKSAPAVAVACVSIPLFDMARVFFTRIIRKKSPFSADRNHIHHLLTDLGLTHSQVCWVLYTMTLVNVFLALVLRNGRSLESILGLLALFVIQIIAIKYFRRKMA